MNAREKIAEFLSRVDEYNIECTKFRAFGEKLFQAREEFILRAKVEKLLRLGEVESMLDRITVLRRKSDGDVSGKKSAISVDNEPDLFPAPFLNSHDASGLDPAEFDVIIMDNNAKSPLPSMPPIPANLDRRSMASRISDAAE